MISFFAIKLDKLGLADSIYQIFTNSKRAGSAKECVNGVARSADSA